MAVQADLRRVSKDSSPDFPRPHSARWDCDPLAEDDRADMAYLTTPRRLLRLAICAADVGARFAREGISEDPAAWMIAPRVLFGERAAIEACQDLDNFRRSVVLNGLQMDLDANPRDIDELLAGADVRDFPASIRCDGEAWERDEGEAEIDLPEPDLYTCWIDASDGRGRILAFMAAVTDRPMDLIERVIGRYGADAAHSATFRRGFDHTTPLATAMLSAAMTDMLREIALVPTSSLAAGVDVTVEQRFAS